MVDTDEVIFETAIATVTHCPTRIWPTDNVGLSTILWQSNNNLTSSVESFIITQGKILSKQIHFKNHLLTNLSLGVPLCQKTILSNLHSSYVLTIYTLKSVRRKLKYDSKCSFFRSHFNFKFHRKTPSLPRPGGG